MQDHDSMIFQIMDPSTKGPRPLLKLASGSGKYSTSYRTQPAGNQSKNIRFGNSAADVKKWVQFRVDFKRDTSNSFISVYIDGQLIQKVSGISTMYGSGLSLPYAWCKFGQYKKDVSKPTTKYYTDFTIREINCTGQFCQTDLGVGDGNGVAFTPSNKPTSTAQVKAPLSSRTLVPTESPGLTRLLPMAESKVKLLSEAGEPAHQENIRSAAVGPTERASSKCKRR
jgi:hypothetical protein